MPRRSTFELHDALLNGELTKNLRAWRSEDPAVSYDEIVARLRVRGVVTTSETVRRWYMQLPAETPAAS